MSSLQEQIQRGIKATVLGILWSTALVVVKILGGILGHSSALIADGIESASDVLLSMVVWRGLRASGKEATGDYHFGYGKAEPLSAAIVSVLMLGAGAAVGVVAVRDIQNPSVPPDLFTLPILLFVILIKEILSKKISHIGAEIESIAVQNDALHHRTDAITSAAAFIGISIAIWGGEKYRVADGIAAAFCSLVIIRNAIFMLRKASHELMDKAPDDVFIAQIVAAASSVPEVDKIEKVLARKSGLSYFVAMHVHADPRMSLFDAHIVSGKVKTAVKRELQSVKDVLVHMEPTGHS